MESGFNKENSNNLPKFDAVMLDRFFASNILVSRSSYGDDAISYVQLKRDAILCTVKRKICPEHKVHAKLYECALVVDEDDDIIVSVLCQNCAASQGGCKHAIAFLMWVHRRSEEPSCTSMECYWKKSKRKTYLIKLFEEETREQSNSSLWFELRYGRITASRAFEVSLCKTYDGTLISLILGGKISDTSYMKRGRDLEDEGQKTMERQLKKKKYEMRFSIKQNLYHDCWIPRWNDG
ncbi:uncharacterized protein LOC123301387 [Chrysoperla carnea]|uniref:uncharacterized protein LOC123301387 n=1 Tax=Chrysoperla carnea TaxID=189513 RepID=UPI001D07E9BC|nr:uncharacterized protein LOC123301387 [Chrysoperla carnea]